MPDPRSVRDDRELDMKCTECIKKDQELVMLKELYQDIMKRFNKLAIKMLKMQEAAK